MNADVIAVPTLDEIVDGAILHGAAVNIAYATTSAGDMLEAARGVQRAIEDWEYDTGLPGTVIPRPMKDVAVMRVLNAGLLAREDRQQLDFFRDRPITDGAARHEARRDLAGVA
jgi:hypothetical protein